LLASPALAGDDLLIYSERLNNGWANWGYNAALVFTNANPVHSGTKSIKATMPAWSRIWLLHDALDPALYTEFAFWAHGGSSGGQQLQFLAATNGHDTGVFVSVPALSANTWSQRRIALSALGVTTNSLLTSLYICNWSGNTQAVFYVDDVLLTASQPPATVHISVNATQVVRRVDARLFGVNTAAWDSALDTPSTISVLTDMDNQVLRWPGGSWGDDYHWAGSHPAWQPQTFNFMHVATNTRAQVYMIANYGSGTPQEAAAWVRYCNLTNQCGFKYWEIGNECGGSWETDHNTNAPWKPHDPWTYAMRFKDYYAQMKAADPTIKVGAVADITEDGTANYTDHPVVNPRTGLTHNGWTPVMLTVMKTNGVIPDFLIEHKYAPNGGDTYALLWCSTWAADAASLRQMLMDYLGAAHTNVELACTEHGGSGDRQRVSLVGGLFWADSLGQILQTEFNSLLWWDLRNGQSSITNSDNALYGWRTNSLGYFYYDEGIVTGNAEPTNRYPTFYCGKLMKHFARGGDQVVNAASDYRLLSAYAVQRTNGSLALLVVNKSSYTTLTAAIAVTGFLPDSNATAYSYGIPQDTAAQTGVGSVDIAQTSFSGAGASFSYVFPPYSATVLSLPPAAPRLAILPPPPSPGGQLILQLQGQAGVRYVLQSATSLAGWLPVSTNTLAGSTMNFTNPVPAGTSARFWRAVWQP
jgi:hypothetical protein